MDEGDSMVRDSMPAKQQKRNTTPEDSAEGNYFSVKHPDPAKYSQQDNWLTTAPESPALPADDGSNRGLPVLAYSHISFNEKLDPCFHSTRNSDIKERLSVPASDDESPVLTNHASISKKIFSTSPDGKFWSLSPTSPTASYEVETNFLMQETKVAQLSIASPQNVTTSTLNECFTDFPVLEKLQCDKSEFPNGRSKLSNNKQCSEVHNFNSAHSPDLSILNKCDICCLSDDNFHVDSKSSLSLPGIQSFAISSSTGDGNNAGAESVITRCFYSSPGCSLKDSSNEFEGKITILTSNDCAQLKESRHHLEEDVNVIYDTCEKRKEKQDDKRMENTEEDVQTERIGNGQNGQEDGQDDHRDEQIGQGDQEKDQELDHEECQYYQEGIIDYRNQLHGSKEDQNDHLDEQDGNKESEKSSDEDVELEDCHGTRNLTKPARDKLARNTAEQETIDASMFKEQTIKRKEDKKIYEKQRIGASDYCEKQDLRDCKMVKRNKVTCCLNERQFNKRNNGKKMFKRVGWRGWKKKKNELKEVMDGYSCETVNLCGIQEEECSADEEAEELNGRKRMYNCEMETADTNSINFECVRCEIHATYDMPSRNDEKIGNKNLNEVEDGDKRKEEQKEDEELKKDNKNEETKLKNSGKNFKTDKLQSGNKSFYTGLDSSLLGDNPCNDNLFVAGTKTSETWNGNQLVHDATGDTVCLNRGSLLDVSLSLQPCDVQNSIHLILQEGKTRAMGTLGSTLPCNNSMQSYAPENISTGFYSEMDHHFAVRGRECQSLSAEPQKRMDAQNEWNDIPEKFLVPLSSSGVRNITTPQEDPGFTKVPGYFPLLESMEEESENICDIKFSDFPQINKNDIKEPIELKENGEEKENEAPKENRELSELNPTNETVEKMISKPLKSLSGEMFDFCLKESTNNDDSASRFGARPKKHHSSFQVPSDFPNPTSSKPAAFSKSARPNCLLGLSKPDVNLPCLKSGSQTSQSSDSIHLDSSDSIHLDSSRTIQLEGSSWVLEKQFPICGESAPSSVPADARNDCSSNVISSLQFPGNTLFTSEAKFLSLPTSVSSCKPTFSVLPTSQRPTSWSPLSSKAGDGPPISAKRPNSLNITVSSVPVCGQLSSASAPKVKDEKTGDDKASHCGLKVPSGAPCSTRSVAFNLVPPQMTLLNNSQTRLDNFEKAFDSVSDVSSTNLVSSASVSVMPPICSNINLCVTELGKVAPIWVPDNDAPRCMQCESRFTFTKRRHHCRACGKVFCSSCCNIRTKLKYLEPKEARICSRCHRDLLWAQHYESSSSSADTSDQSRLSVTDTIPPAALLTRLSVGGSSRERSVLKVESKSNSLPKPESKLVRVCDSNCANEVTLLTSANTHLIGDITRGNSIGTCKPSLSPASREMMGIRTVTAEVLVHECENLIMNGDLVLESSAPSTVTLLPNLSVTVSVVNLDCCLEQVCWCFVTSGLCAVGQDEIIFVLKCLPGEERVPRDIFCHICQLYHQAARGRPVGCLGHSLVSKDQVFLGSPAHAGFLYIQPTFQCLHKLPLPPAPYLFGILILRAEVPWVNVFPIRLMLRLGAEYRYYPCPLVSIRFRDPVYGEIGHTIMNLLVDLRNYQYRLPHIDGLVVHMEDKKTYIHLPRKQYADIKRAFSNNNDHVMALEANFSCVADSHLVCFQNPDGKYVTQAINIQNRPRKITGASFIVFSGALKSISGMNAKCSMVEDGLMVQVSPESVRQLKCSIANMEDFSIGCGRISVPHPEEWVILKWVDDNKDVNLRSFNRVTSPIDGLLLDGVRSRRIYPAIKYVGKRFAICWTEIFYIHQSTDESSERNQGVEFEETVSQACCIALSRHLGDVKLEPLTRIGLRVYLGLEKIGFEIGANLRPLPDFCISDITSKLIPLLQGSQGCNSTIASTFELFFYLVEHQ